jgi:hypothetical protein
VISTQEAFGRAKQYATEFLGEKEYTLEEIEQDVYKNRPRLARYCRLSEATRFRA